MGAYFFPKFIKVTLPHFNVNIVYEWSKSPKKDGNRLLTFPLLIMQFWPQYHLLKLVYHNRFQERKEEYDRKIHALSEGLTYLLS